MRMKDVICALPVPAVQASVHPVLPESASSREGMVPGGILSVVLLSPEPWGVEAQLSPQEQVI
jgi:hypothetical protein